VPSVGLPGESSSQFSGSSTGLNATIIESVIPYEHRNRTLVRAVICSARRTGSALPLHMKNRSDEKSWGRTSSRWAGRWATAPASGQIVTPACAM
jgi:hypothetical protein